METAVPAETCWATVEVAGKGARGRLVFSAAIPGRRQWRQRHLDRFRRCRWTRWRRPNGRGWCEPHLGGHQHARADPWFFRRSRRCHRRAGRQGGPGASGQTGGTGGAGQSVITTEGTAIGGAGGKNGDTGHNGGKWRPRGIGGRARDGYPTTAIGGKGGDGAIRGVDGGAGTPEPAGQPFGGSELGSTRAVPATPAAEAAQVGLAVPRYR